MITLYSWPVACSASADSNASVFKVFAFLKLAPDCRYHEHVLDCVRRPSRGRLPLSGR